MSYGGVIIIGGSEAGKRIVSFLNSNFPSDIEARISAMPEVRNLMHVSEEKASRGKGAKRQRKLDRGW